MRILYAAMKHEYGDPKLGFSFEHHNFHDSLLRMGCDILYFDFMGLLREHGKEWMNRRLVEAAESEKPDLLFTFLYTDQFEKDAIRRISRGGRTVTLNWFADDHWRFEGFSRHWAPCFNWAVTTSRAALPRYEKLRCRNVIRSQWACNHFLYRKLDLPLEREVTFVGAAHGNRREVLESLRAAGLNVQAWGGGWEAGRLTQEEMIRVFNQSRVNLNLSNASAPVPTFASRVRDVLRKWRRDYPSVLGPLGRLADRFGRKPCSAGPSAPGAVGEAPRAPSARRYPEQIKGRNFEVPGCAGFLLTGRAEDLAEYYAVGKEIVCFDDEQDLLDKARHFLEREDRRAAIAQAGYERTLREHTYCHRFREIFARIGLPCPPLEAILSGQVPPGRSEEVR